MALGASAAWAQSDRIGSIEVSNPWAPPTGSTLTNTAVYLSLTDVGTKSDELVGASSAVAQKTELHVFDVENGVYGMHKVDGIEVTPGGAGTVLRPGGAHIMLEVAQTAAARWHDLSVDANLPARWTAAGRSAGGEPGVCRRQSKLLAERETNRSNV